MAVAKAAIDTGVLIEYLDLEGTLHRQAGEVFSALLAGRVEAILPHPVLAETYYVAARLYEATQVQDPHVLAGDVIRWLVSLPATKVMGEEARLAIEAGRAKLAHSLALTDCYVLAASRIQGCKALFRSPEREMSRSVDLLREEYDIIFLSDYP